MLARAAALLLDNSSSPHYQFSASSSRQDDAVAVASRASQTKLQPATPSPPPLVEKIKVNIDAVQRKHVLELLDDSATERINNAAAKKTSRYVCPSSDATLNFA